MKQQPHRCITRDEITTAVDRMEAIAAQLRRDQATNITRLTILKRLCEDSIAAARFGLYLANRVQAKTAKKYRPLVREGLKQLKAHVAQSRKVASESLRTTLHALEESQNEVRHQRWANVRIIRSHEALLAEYALCIAARPWESAFWGYCMAAYYIERYDSRYGTGLIPASLPALEDIIRFWSRYAGRLRKGKPSRTAKSAPPLPPRKRVARSGTRL